MAFESSAPTKNGLKAISLERETGFEPAISTLARSRDTTTLLPLTNSYNINLSTPKFFPSVLDYKQ